MRAIVLKRFNTNDAKKAFVLEERPIPEPQAHEVCIHAEGFGLNFADVMARQGLYQDCPDLPTVIGYEVVGKIHKVGKDVKHLKEGQRVVALTRFGGYAEYAVTQAEAAAVIPEDMDMGIATALATQYITAYHCAEDSVRLHPGDHVLIQAAAGGVGTALVQYAKHKGCIVYGTAGSEKKLEYLREQGVDFPINYRTTDFYQYIKEKRGNVGLDVVFDCLGGSEMKKGVKLLATGGKIVFYGAASRSGAKWGLFSTLNLAAGFGVYSPIPFVQNSKGMVGVNMLRIADRRPDKIQYCLKNVIRLTQEGIFKPVVGGRFSYKELDKAHMFLQSRQSIGKVAVSWAD
ncbi:MAG: zinc-binding dehydrogenase [Saprospiraceae bacterium]|nr:zinc-binding dehydrogenase [Saprospiraceae bacterium]